MLNIDHNFLVDCEGTDGNYKIIFALIFLFLSQVYTNNYYLTYFIILL